MTIRHNRSEYYAHADLRRIARAVYAMPAPRHVRRARDRRIVRFHAAMESIAAAAAYAVITSACVAVLAVLAHGAGLVTA